MRKRLPKKDKVYHFIEEYGITLILGLLLLTLILNKLLIVNNSKFGVPIFELYFTTTFKDTLQNKDSTLITIAAVFIGIYFTVFTLLSSIKVDSTFAILTKKNFVKLLKYIRNAFIGSFLYLLLSLFSPSETSDWAFSILALALMLYMLLSALRFGTIIYLIFSKDVKKYYDTIESEKANQRKRDNLFARLEIFLKAEEDKREIDRAKALSETLKKKKK